MIEVQGQDLKKEVQQQRNFGKEEDAVLEFLEQCTEENLLSNK